MTEYIPTLSLPSKQRNFDLRDFLSLINRQKQFIGFTLVIGVGVVFVFLTTMTPLYRAEALIRVAPVEQNILTPEQQIQPTTATLSARVESEVEILRSAEMALAVVNAGQLVLDPEFGPRLSTYAKLRQALGLPFQIPSNGDRLLQETVSRVLEARDVRRRGLTYVIALAVTAKDPQRAADLANLYAKTYVSEQVAAKIDASILARDILSKHAATVQTELAVSEERIDQYLLNSVGSFTTQTDSQNTLRMLKDRLTTIQNSRQGLDLKADLAEAALVNRDWKTLSQTLADQSLEALALEQERLAQALANVPQNVSNTTDLRSALQEIDQELEDRAMLQMNALEKRVERLDRDIAHERQQMRMAYTQADLTPEVLAEVFALQKNAELARVQYQTALARLSDLEAQAAVQVADSYIVSAALPPHMPHFPKPTFVLSIAFVLSLVVGVGAASLNEYFIGGVTSERELASIIHSPVAASIPQCHVQPGQTSNSDIVVSAPFSEYSEAFRLLRISVDRAVYSKSLARGSLAPVILVTSAVSGEGKSTTALSLARTFSLADRETVLIDADLRKPTLPRLLGQTPALDFVECLTTDRAPMPTTPPSFIYQDPLTSLSVVHGTKRSMVPPDMFLSSESFASFLHKARTDFELVILDTPPILPVVDTRSLLHHADVVILVTHLGTTAQAEILKAVSEIRTSILAHTDIINVLNRSSLSTRVYDNDNV